MEEKVKKLRGTVGDLEVKDAWLEYRLEKAMLKAAMLEGKKQGKNDKKGNEEGEKDKKAASSPAAACSLEMTREELERWALEKEERTASDDEWLLADEDYGHLQIGSMERLEFITKGKVLLKLRRKVEMLEAKKQGNKGEVVYHSIATPASSTVCSLDVASSSWDVASTSWEEKELDKKVLDDKEEKELDKKVLDDKEKELDKKVLDDKDKNLFILIAGLPGSGKSSGLAKAMMNYEGGEYKVISNQACPVQLRGQELRAHGQSTRSIPRLGLPASQASANQGLPRLDGGQAACHRDRRTEGDQFTTPREHRMLVQHPRDLLGDRREHSIQACPSSRWHQQGVQANVLEKSARCHLQYQSLNASQFSDSRWHTKCRQSR